MTPRTFIRAAAATAAIILTAPAPAHADTLCEDGWISPSDGGPGTCSWHGGIAGNDNDSGGGWRIPIGNGGNDGDQGIGPALIAISIAGGIWWLFKQIEKDIDKDKDKR